MRIRVYSLLNQLEEKHGMQEFGKICQILLGLCLVELNYKIQIFQLTGRPDIIAIRDNVKYAFEVKTQSTGNAILKPEDTNGVKEYTDQSIIAVLSYPDLDCNWIMANVEKINCVQWPIPLLKQYSNTQLENEINQTFPKILKTYYPLANQGKTILYQRFKEIYKPAQTIKAISES